MAIPLDNKITGYDDAFEQTSFESTQLSVSLTS